MHRHFCGSAAPARCKGSSRLQWLGFLEAPLHGKTISGSRSGSRTGSRSGSRTGSRSGGRGGKGSTHGIGTAIMPAIVVTGKGHGSIQKNP